MSYTFAANGASNTKVSFFLLEIAFVNGTLRLTNADIDIATVAGAYSAGATPGAHTWLARSAGGGRSFVISSISAGIAETAGSEKIILDNADNYISAILFGAHNPAGAVVKVYEALFDPANLTTNKPDDVKLRLLRRVASMSLKADVRKREAEITLDPYVVLQSLVMGRRHLGPKCTFAYREAESCQATPTTGTATFTNGSTSVTSVSPALAATNCLVGATVTVGSVTGVVSANTTTTITLSSAWTGTTGASQSFGAIDASCDHTLTACSMPTKRSGTPANGNRDNFGGFVTIPATSL